MPLLVEQVRLHPLVPNSSSTTVVVIVTVTIETRHSFHDRNAGAGAPTPRRYIPNLACTLPMWATPVLCLLLRRLHIDSKLRRRERLSAAARQREERWSAHIRIDAAVRVLAPGLAAHLAALLAE
jgi:hypothetical protein